MGTKERLISATQDLLWERGYAATSPKDILRKAEAGQGSMYHHFSGKQDLAVTALEETAAGMRASAEELLHGEGSPVERVRAYLTRQRDSLKGCRIGRMTYDTDVLVSPELLAPVAQTLAWLVAALADVIAEGIECGQLRADVDAREVASMLVATIQGGYVLARAGQDPAAFDAAVRGALQSLTALEQPAVRNE
ncbi:MAG: TetR/AcrR family transcriptional regulator [Corynebacterium matruchotii]|uniref:TetR/AcrR family transcriptional regulator n=1 Tax=Corynebacterium matruchotii TaxID=43768 RepID=UPI002880B5C6|nr:TetR/AcrR family transcriptional regulator [Corynebacterium matruchotii]